MRVAMSSSPTYMSDDRPNRYQISHPGALSPGFLPPSSPFEGRRDSIASSFATYTSDYSIPATPTYDPSPLSDSFIDIAQYDIPSHGLPLQLQQKDSTYQEAFHEWSMIQTH